MRKRRKINQNNKKIFLTRSLPILFVIIIFALSIGFSAFQETMLIGETIVDIPIVVDTQITNLSSYSSYKNGSLGSLEYEVNNITGTVTLPESDSTATMLVEVTNLENAESGIREIDITSDNDKLEYTIEPGYVKRQKICDDNNPSKCTLGAKKTMYITLSVEDTKYDSTDTTDNFELDFDFEGYYTITYINITGTYQSEVMGNDTLEVDFSSNAPFDVSVSMGGSVLSSGYTYFNDILTINSVTGNTTITGLDVPVGCYAVEALEDPTKGKIVAYDESCGLNVTIPQTLPTSTLQGTFDEPTCLLSYTQQECDDYETLWNERQFGFLHVNTLGLISGFDIIESNNTVTIQEIGYSAFASIGINSLNLNHATGLTTIGNFAFFRNHLTNLTIPSSITSIGEFAFNSNFLTSLDLSRATNLTTIQSGAFSYNMLRSISFSNSITSIGSFSFQNNRLESIMIPDSVTSIGSSAFSENELTSVYIGSSINSIGNSSFSSGTTIYDEYHNYTYGPNAITSITIDASESDVTLDLPFEGFTGTICWLKDNPSCGAQN